MTTMDGGLRKLFRQNLSQFDWTSIESGSTGGGIPDSNYCCDGIEGWIEYKITPGHTVMLRPEQIGWIMRRTRFGGRVHIAVRQRSQGGPRHDPRDILWLIPGALAQQAKQHGLRALEESANVQVHYNGPAHWNWREIAQALMARS